MHLSRDWTEDFPHENGKYQNECLVCRETFLGHKRRVVCKLCASMPKTVVIKELRFAKNLGFGGDAWLPYGVVFDHPGFPDGEEIFTSSPIDFDEKSFIMKTASGRSYQIESFCEEDGGKDKWIAEINKEVAKNKAIIARKNA
jgi:hypothetical protein